MYAKPTGSRQGPRSLHFRGRRPIPRLPKLASSSARPAAALRDVVLRLGEGRRGRRADYRATMGIGHPLSVRNLVAMDVQFG